MRDIFVNREGANNGQRFNMKYDLAEYIIRRAAEDGKELSVSTNMFAYFSISHFGVCFEPILRI